MLNYRDTTFCPFWGNCESAEGCSRPLTVAVASKAKEAGLPIAFFTAPPKCHKPRAGSVKVSSLPSGFTNVTGGGDASE